MSDDQPVTLTAEIAKVDPELLEQQMVNKAQNEPLGNPEDLAAVFFKMNYPRLKMLLSKLSKRGIERAVICAAAYPLVPDGYKPKDQDESKLAWVLEQMVSSKALMITRKELDKLDSIDDLKVVDEKQTLIKGEKENDSN